MSIASLQGLPSTPAASSCELGRVLDEVKILLEVVRTTERSGANDEERLGWVDQIRDITRRATAMASVLVNEADEAGSAMRARHSRLEDWMARTGQETTRETSGAVWAARGLERRPAVLDAASRGQISMGQAKAINEALDALPTRMEHSLKVQAERLILTEAAHAPSEKLRTMADRLVRQVA
ncbi:MAG: DUF222 domain-containing protein, partial [Actinobacteria bacterium]|nr:DUF222 domain-containing protein [Actinomycetota bacterium]